MGAFVVAFSDEAKKHLKKIKKSGRKIDLKKLDTFVKEVAVHPRMGIGHPERMKHHVQETWSGEVNEKDRFVYEIYEDEMLIVVKQVLGHYRDR